MKYCSCRHCDAGFEFTGASKDKLGWHTTCPECGGSFDIDIEDYVVSRGTLVGLHSGMKGVITTFTDEYAAEFDEIVYLVTYRIGDKEHTTRVRRDDFDIIEDWKLLKRTEFGIERVCHYPVNQEWSNVPCYNCADRAKCNHDIFNRLAQYEDTDMPPDVVAEYKKFEDELVASGLTFGEVLELIREAKK